MSQTTSTTLPASTVAPTAGSSLRASARRGVDAARARLFVAGPYLLVTGIAAFVRFWDLARVGYNSDEAVYAGTAASIAGNESLRPMFPIFRAHPALFQLILSLGFHGEVSDWMGRAIAASVGVAAVLLTCALGARLYGRTAGVVAGLVIAIMPYHVIVSRQVLLDGLMTCCATGVLYCVVRYSETASPRWMIAAGGAMGATFLSKETSLVLLGGLYVYFALTPRVRVRLWHVALGVVPFTVIALAYPITLATAGRSSSSGQHYFLWQMFRRSNHGWTFYADVVPWAVGPLVLVAVLAGLVWLRGESTWRERLLLSWMVVPILFFCLWPVKGYQYLLPIAPALAVLAGRTVSRLPTLTRLAGRRRPAVAAVAGVTAVLVASLLIPTWERINPSTSGTFLAGTGGVPGGREAGLWIRGHVPADAELLAIGPSMANILEFYGRHRVYGLSVSPNPLSRNPAYTPVANPDSSVRGGDFQYIVWDSYTAGRAHFFAATAQRLIDKYHGVAVFTATVTVGGSGHTTVKPVIVIYQVKAAR